jgi:predicted RNA-binding protein Jag
MSEDSAATTPVAAAPADSAQQDAAKRELALQVLTELLRLMDLPGRVEAKDAPDGGISVALHLDGPFPGVQAGRRSHVVDAVQFLANKLVNRAGTTKRWIAIGVGGHPEPRVPGEKPRRPPALAPPPAVLPHAAPSQRPAPRAPAPATPAAVEDESTVQVPADPALNGLGQLLAQRSATLGWYYAVAPMKADDRARVLKAAQAVPGVRVYVEGEGRNRRLVFAPDKPAPLPKRSALPQDDEELEA